MSVSLDPITARPLEADDVNRQIGAMTVEFVRLSQTLRQYVDRERELLAEVARLRADRAEGACPTT